jgi:hypothetical protein
MLGRRRRGKRGWGASGKVLIFGMLKIIQLSPPFALILCSKLWVAACQHRAKARCSSSSKMLIISAAMRKLLHIACGVLKSQRPFDPVFSVLST